MFHINKPRTSYNVHALPHAHPALPPPLCLQCSTSIPLLHPPPLLATHHHHSPVGAAQYHPLPHSTPTAAIQPPTTTNIAPNNHICE